MSNSFKALDGAVGLKKRAASTGKNAQSAYCSVDRWAGLGLTEKVDQLEHGICFAQGCKRTKKYERTG